MFGGGAVGGDRADETRRAALTAEIRRRAGLHRDTIRNALAAYCRGVARLEDHPAEPELHGNFEAGRRFANQLDFKISSSAGQTRVNARVHRTTRARVAQRVACEREQMRRLPSQLPGSERRWVTRVAPQPYLRFDTDDYSLDPRLVGRRVEVSASQHERIAVALDTGELAARTTLEELDFTFQRSLKRQVVEHLGQLDFLHAREHVVLLGPPGTGKTHLAIALGIRACLGGQRVQFATATEWVARLGEAKRRDRWRRSCAGCPTSR